jgi:hypothetical protein
MTSLLALRGGSTDAGFDEGLQIFKPIPDRPTRDLHEAGASSLIAPSLEGAFRQSEIRRGFRFGKQDCWCHGDHTSKLITLMLYTTEPLLSKVSLLS